MYQNQPEWPYPVNYRKENEISTDVLVLGGGIAGCWAAIAAARKGAKVAIAEKAATIRSGAGGWGVDHWFNSPSPASKVTPEEVVDWERDQEGGYFNGITRYILAREGYDTLLEMEQMGGKIRDAEDEFKGAPFRDEETKLLYAYDYENKLVIRVWGLTFKPALYKECKRLGVEIYDRVAVTSLLTERGKQGARVVGATGVSGRTGEFYIFKAKATILSMGRTGRIWIGPLGQVGLPVMREPNNIGTGFAIAWRAGVEFTEMERSGPSTIKRLFDGVLYSTGDGPYIFGGCSVIDAKGKEVPWIDVNGRILSDVSERYRPAAGQGVLVDRGKTYKHKRPWVEIGTILDHVPKDSTLPTDLVTLAERITRAGYTLPFYADWPSMPEHERKAWWGLMVGNEGKTKGLLDIYSAAGFNPSKDLLQAYQQFGQGTIGAPWERNIDWHTQGGILHDWDLRTNLDGLYVAGDAVFSGNFHSHAAATGRYAGRKAAGYALKAAEPAIAREQVDKEKARVCAPIEREDGIGWKELNNAISQVMQVYCCGDIKNEETMKIGLVSLKELQKEDLPRLCAKNPHQLVRALEIPDILTCSQIIMHACLARKAGSSDLSFKRLDYPEMDPPEWHKWITLKLEGGEVKVDELPIDFFEPLKENYETHRED